jgi:hypothetical protein
VALTPEPGTHTPSSSTAAGPGKGARADASIGQRRIAQRAAREPLTLVFYCLRDSYIRCLHRNLKAAA